SYNGVYEPALYFLPGVAGRLGWTPASGVRLARSASALVSLLLIGLAGSALFERRDGGWSIVGLALAVTPMVVFMSSTVNPNAAEITGSLCLAAGLISLSRSEQAHHAWLAIGSG